MERLVLLGGPPDQDYLATGLTDELVASLSRFGDSLIVVRSPAARVLDPHGVVYRSLERQPAAGLGTYLAVFRYHEYEARFIPRPTCGPARNWIGQSGKNPAMPMPGPCSPTHLFALWPQACEEMPEILAFWFPSEGLAAIFADGLAKAGLPVLERLAETKAGLGLAARTQQSDAACG